MEYTIGDKKNEFEKRYSANNERINILMENFQFFHRTNSENINDPKYICPLGGYEQFSNWLKFNKARSASYLITGYRGAGKTGFVHYVINDLNKRKEINKKFVLTFFQNEHKKCAQLCFILFNCCRRFIRRTQIICKFVD